MSYNSNIAPPVASGQDPLEPGQARRWLKALPKESRAEAMQRAKKTMPWGKSIVRPPTSCKNLWTFTVRL